MLRKPGARSRLRPLIPRPVDEESTLRLLERSRAGDQEATERLFARERVPLRRWARGRLPKCARDLADTDDLVQDALVQTFRRLDAFEPRRAGALQAYLRQALLNRLRNELRRRGRQPQMLSLDDVDCEAPESPLDRAIGREARVRYEQALQRLTASERAAIIARVEFGYSYEDLAAILGKPTAEAARKAARRAVVRLAEEMHRAPD